MVDDNPGRERQLSTDRETIRNWADRHDVVPVREERSTGEDSYRMVPEREVGTDDERVEWSAFFEEFQGGDRVVVYHGEESSDPMELSDHDSIAVDLDDDEVEEQLLEGETVTSTVTETAVVEEVVTEELTIESELADRQTVHQEVVDVELLDRDVVDHDLVEDEVGTTETGYDAGFDEDRYLDAVGGTTDAAPGSGPTTVDTTDLPYHPEMEVEERWAVTRDVTEEYVVESEIIGAEVTEAETLEDYDLDVEGLHRTIAESGIIEDDLSTEEFITDFEPESEIAEEDRVTTSFTRHRTVEDEIRDRKRLHGEFTGGEVVDVELVGTEEVVGTDVGTTDTGTVGEGSDLGAGDEMNVGSGDTSAPDAGAQMGSSNTRPGGATLDEGDVGKTVVDPTGDEIGTVSEVDTAGGAMYVDPNPGLTERIKSALGWGGADEEDHRLDVRHVDHVGDDEVRLDHDEDLEDDTSGRR